MNRTKKANLVALFGGCSWVGDFILVVSSGRSVGTFVGVLNIQRGIIDNVPIKYMQI